MKAKDYPALDPAVAAVLANYPLSMRRKLMRLRQLIYDVAAGTPEIGTLAETLKWGEPAYLTPETKSGSLIRFDRKKHNPAQYALYFHCQTGLVDSFRVLFPDVFTYEGNRAIVFEEADTVPEAALRVYIRMALTYRLRKQESASRRKSRQ